MGHFKINLLKKVLGHIYNIKISTIILIIISKNKRHILKFKDNKYNLYLYLLFKIVARQLYKINNMKYNNTKPNKLYIHCSNGQQLPNVINVSFKSLGIITNNGKTFDNVEQDLVNNPVAINTASKRILKIMNKEDSLEYK